MLDPAFCPSEHGRILCMTYRPAEPGEVGLLFLPPFAEEMNKSRRMMARLGHALAEHGVTTVIPDLYGTGDSDGEFGEADWQRWRRDAATAVERLQHLGCHRLVVGGLRLGALLALDVIPELPQKPQTVLLWHPVLQGRSFLTQFLRLRLAAGLGEADRESTTELRNRLAAGESLEIAGYELAPELAAVMDALEAADLQPPLDVPTFWLEVSRHDPPVLTPAAAKVVQGWRHSGVAVQEHPVSGEPFWALQEPPDALELVHASVRWVTGEEGAVGG